MHWLRSYQFCSRSLNGEAQGVDDSGLLRSTCTYWKGELVTDDDQGGTEEIIASAQLPMGL